jgi:2-polyprenyl-3-methyl-5-hydroxy-6-metoxy-1,4-benzoquinol methylase
MVELPFNQRAASLVEEAFLHYSPLPGCPLCGGSEFKEYGIKKYKTIKFVKCECGMVFQPTYFTPEDLDEYYKNNYRLCVIPYSDRITERNIRGELDSGKRYMQFVSGITPKRHLDIGSSTGTFLNAMQHVHGCESVGVEPGEAFREYSINSGIKTVADLNDVEGTFDLITMAHVLEHFTDPLDRLRIVSDLLEDDGVLFVEVPYMCVAHSHPLMFNKTLFEKMLNKAGFDIIKLQQHSVIRIMALAIKRRTDDTNNT